MPEDTAKTADSNSVSELNPTPTNSPAIEPNVTPDPAFPNTQPVETPIPASVQPEPAPVTLSDNADIAASPIQTPPPTTTAADAHPEIVSNPEKSSNHNLIIVASILLFVGVLGVFGYFFYNMMMPKPETNVIRSNQPESIINATPIATPIPTPTVDEMMTGVNTSVTGLDGDIDAIDSQIKDKQGDLSE